MIVKGVFGVPDGVFETTSHTMITRYLPSCTTSHVKISALVVEIQVSWDHFLNLMFTTLLRNYDTTCVPCGIMKSFEKRILARPGRARRAGLPPRCPGKALRASPTGASAVVSEDEVGTGAGYGPSTTMAANTRHPQITLHVR